MSLAELPEQWYAARCWRHTCAVRLRDACGCHPLLAPPRTAAPRHVRPELAGYGVVFFAECVLADAGEELKGKRCIVTGSG